jgi:hypothetical protein
MTSPENHISDYLDGQLNQADLVAFERAMAQNAALRETVALQRRIEAELGVMQDQDEIAGLISRAESKHPYPKHRVEIHRLWPLLAIAASVLLVLGGWFALRPAGPDAAALAAHFGALNTPATVLPTRYGQVRAKPEAGDPLTLAATSVDSAHIYVYLEQYPEALRSYQAIPPGEMTDSLNFEFALVLLQLNRPASALERMRQVKTDYSGGLYWYQALALLQQDDIQAARTQVQKLLKTPESPYHQGALELLETLD